MPYTVSQTVMRQQFVMEVASLGSAIEFADSLAARRYGAARVLLDGRVVYDTAQPLSLVIVRR